MTWGFLSTAHIVSLILAVGIIAALYFLLRKAKNAIKIAVLGILSFAGIDATIYNLVVWNSPLEYLPLHLCSLNALVLPFAVFTRRKALNNLLLLWSLGALIALVLNTSVAEAEILSWTFVFYYFPHVLEFGIPVLMFLLKLVKKDVKCIATTLGITMASYTAIHFVNLWINSYAFYGLYCIANFLDLACPHFCCNGFLLPCSAEAHGKNPAQSGQNNRYHTRCYCGSRYHCLLRRSSYVRRIVMPSN